MSGTEIGGRSVALSAMPLTLGVEEWTMLPFRSRLNGVCVNIGMRQLDEISPLSRNGLCVAVR